MAEHLRRETPEESEPQRHHQLLKRKLRHHLNLNLNLLQLKSQLSSSRKSTNQCKLGARSASELGEPLLNHLLLRHSTQHRLYPQVYLSHFISSSQHNSPTTLSLLRSQPSQLIILRKTTTTSFSRHYLLCSPFSPCSRTLFWPLSTLWKWCLRNGTTSLLLLILIHHSLFSLSQSYQHTHTHIFCRTSPQLLCPSLTTNFSFTSFCYFPYLFIIVSRYTVLLSPSFAAFSCTLFRHRLFHSFVQPTQCNLPSLVVVFTTSVTSAYLSSVYSFCFVFVLLSVLFCFASFSFSLCRNFPNPLFDISPSRLLLMDTILHSTGTPHSHSHSNSLRPSRYRVLYHLPPSNAM